MNPVILAAVTVSPRGGGIAAVSRLMWRVLRDRWPDACRLVTLLDEAEAARSLHATKAMRLRFGARLAKEQLLGDSAFVLYSHLALAQVQSYIPGVVRRPYGIFLHGIEAWRPLSAERRRVVERASILISNSEYTAARVKTTHPWIGPISVCPLALPFDADARQGSDPEANGSTKAREVLTVARMASKERYKGHDQLLEAWPTVLARVPDARLVFAGTGDDVARLKAKAASIGVASSVTFTGFVSEETLQALYRSAAVFAMPSRGEGFGLVYLEAMHHGVPCIGSTHDAASETIEHGTTGLLASQDDVAGLADAISRLLTDEPLRREMGRRAFDRSQSRFGYPAFRDRLCTLLMNTAAGSSQLVSSQFSV